MCFTRIRFVLLPMLLVFLADYPVAAQGPDTAADNTVIAGLEQKVGDFFADLKTSPDSTKSSRLAFEKVLEGSTRLLDKTAALGALIKRTDALTTTFGNYRGSERISAKSIGKDLVLMKYLYKCEQYPIVWHFTFYRKQNADPTAGQWIVIAVRFDTDLELLALER